MNIKSATALLLLLAPLTSFAEGDREGNGGDALVCRDAQGEITRAEAFDLYEGNLLNGYTYEDSKSWNNGFWGNGWVGKASVSLERFDRFTDLDLVNYFGMALKLVSEGSMVHGVDLIDVPDTHTPIIPRGCKIEQLIIQKAVNGPLDHALIINGDIWDRLSPTDQAAMAIHESLLWNFRENSGSDLKDTRQIRQMTSAIFADRAGGPGLGTFLAIFAGYHSQTKTIYWQNKEGSVGYFLKGENLTAQVAAGNEGRINSYMAGELDVWGHNNSGHYKLKLGGTWEFLNDGNLESVKIDPKVGIHFNELHVLDVYEYNPVKVSGEARFFSEVELRKGDTLFRLEANLFMNNFDWRQVKLDTGDVGGFQTSIEIEKGGVSCLSTKKIAPLQLQFVNGIAPAFSLDDAKKYFEFDLTKEACKAIFAGG